MNEEIKTTKMKNTSNKFFSLEEVKEIWKAGQEYWKTSGESKTFEETIEPLGELLSDRRFTLKEAELIFGLGAANHANGKPSFEEVIKSLSQQSWKVECVEENGKIKILKLL